jgi:CxxC-x17-CxxC domain-containing protein
LVSFSDKTITCRDCGQPFVWTASEQDFYQSRGFENQPVRCRDCRNRRKSERAGGQGGSSTYSTGYSNGGGQSSSRGTREMFPAVCDECGKQTQVPFQPTSGKPVYCSDCFERRRNYR